MNQKTYTITVTGMLVAVTLLLGATSIGIISIPPANITIMHIPVIIGTLVCGLKAGMALSLVFGLTSVYKAFTATSLLVAPLLEKSPVLVILMAVGARLMIPVVTFFVYKAFQKVGHIRIGTGVSAIAGTLTNTVCYLGLMLLFYTLTGINSAAVLGVITGVGALNGSLEALAAFILCTPIVIAIKKKLYPSA
jgi:uncharacterized membrane protein